MRSSLSILGLLAVVMAVDCTCNFPNPSEQFRCTVNADCDVGRTCVDGWCAVADCASDPPPPELTRCVLANDPAGPPDGYCSGANCVECTLNVHCGTPPGNAEPTCFDASCAGQSCTYAVAASRVCEAARCEQASMMAERLCGSDGTCPTASVVDCGPYICSATSDACLTSCQSSQDCGGTTTCLPTGACEAPQADGAACERDIDCESGRCECGDPTCDVAAKKCSPDSCPACTYSTDPTSACLAGVAPISNGFDDADDSCGLTTCNGASACRLPDAAICNANQDCASDICTCADATCSLLRCSADVCPACTFATAVNPPAPCTTNNAPIDAGFDDALDSCGTGTCDGLGGCGLPNGQLCVNGSDCQSGSCECTDAICDAATRRCSPDTCAQCTFSTDTTSACLLAPGFVAPGFADATGTCPTGQCNGRGGCFGVLSVVESYTVGDVGGFDYAGYLGGFLPGSTPKITIYLNSTTPANQAIYGQISLDPSTHLGTLDWTSAASHNGVQVTQLTGPVAMRSRRVWGQWDGFIAGYQFGSTGITESPDTNHGNQFYVGAYRVHDTRGLGWSSTNSQGIRMFDYAGGTTITASNELTFGDIYTRVSGESMVNWNGDVVIHYKLYGTPLDGRPSGSLGLYTWDGTSGAGLEAFQHDDLVPSGMSTTSSSGRLIRTSYGAMLFDVETRNTWRIARSGTSLSVAETGIWSAPVVELNTVDWTFGGARGPYVGKEVGPDRWLTTYRSTSGASESISTALVDLSDFRAPSITPVRIDVLTYDSTQWTLAPPALMPAGTSDLIMSLRIPGGGRSARIVYIQNAM